MSRHRQRSDFPELVRAFEFYDGDSIKVQDWDEIGPFVGEFHGMSWNARLKGIDAPEVNRPLPGGRFVRKPDLGGLESRDFLRNLVKGCQLRMVVYGFEYYGRPLGVFWLEGHERSVNLEMILQGWARATDGEGCLTVGEFSAKDAEKCARARRCGIWADSSGPGSTGH